MALHRPLRRISGLVFLWFLGAGGRLPKERRGLVFIAKSFFFFVRGFVGIYLSAYLRNFDVKKIVCWSSSPPCYADLGIKTLAACARPRGVCARGVIYDVRDQKRPTPTTPSYAHDDGVLCGPRGVFPSSARRSRLFRRCMISQRRRAKAIARSSRCNSRYSFRNHSYRCCCSHRCCCSRRNTKNLGARTPQQRMGGPTRCGPMFKPP